MAEKKYKVAENQSVIVKGVVLKSGEAIPAGAVNETALKQLVEAKLVVEDKDAKSSDGKDAKSADGKDAKSADGKDAKSADGKDAAAQQGGAKA